MNAESVAWKFPKLYLPPPFRFSVRNMDHKILSDKLKK
jgi:hypothetical protein